MSDSDDDIPISELIKKRKLQQQAAVKAEAKAKPEVKKVKTEKAEKPAKSERSSDSKSNNPLSRVTNFNKAAEFYTETQKGLMVQKFLIRWWYAMEWPLPDEIGIPPPGYESLDGFKGVFVSTKTDSLGKIVDLRNHDNAPSLQNLSKMNSAKIKDLCKTAIKNQMEQLLNAEGEGKLYRELKSELSTIDKIDCDKADKDAKKYVF